MSSLKDWLRKLRIIKTKPNTEDSQDVDIQARPEQTGSAVEYNIADPMSRNAEQMRRFQSEIVGNLREPEVRKGQLIIGWVVSVFTPLIAFFLCLLFGSPIFGSFFSVFLLASLVFFFGIRYITTLHCGLLYNLGRRTRIGFWEGWVWIPWFTGGTLKIFNCERFSYDIPREDNWTQDQMHLVYDIVFRFGVVPVAEKSFLENLFWYFHQKYETDTYYYYSSNQENDLGQGLFNFIINTDVETAVMLAIADAKRSTMLAIRMRSFKDIFHFVDDEPVITPEKVAELEAQLEKEIIARLNKRIYNTGIIAADFTFADLDFDKEATAALQKRQIAPMLARAEKIAYETLIEIGRELSLDTTVGEATLRVQVVEALKKAADNGIVGALLTGTTLERLASVSKIPKTDRIIVSE